MVQLMLHAQYLGSRELFLIELQGKLMTQAPQRQNLPVGDLEVKSNGTAFLNIGYHRLEGKVVGLKKPLAVLRHRRQNVNDDAFQTDYDVIDILRHKIVFNTRPEPIHQMVLDDKSG